MSFANWTDSYSVHVHKLDSEHQQLFSVVNQLHEAMKAGRGKDALRSVLTQLVHYTEQHFRDEEALMQQAGYANLGGHITQHQQFVTKVKGFCKEYESGAAAISVEVLEFLKGWLVEHIMGADQQYSAALNRHGIH